MCVSKGRASHRHTPCIHPTGAHIWQYSNANLSYNTGNDVGSSVFLKQRKLDTSPQSLPRYIQQVIKSVAWTTDTKYEKYKHDCYRYITFRFGI